MPIDICQLESCQNDNYVQDLQRRLSYLLRNYRKERLMSGTEFAEKISVDKSTYSRLENPTIPHKRFVRSIQFINDLAKYLQLSPTEFIYYLTTGKALQVTLGNGRTLYQWEKDILSIFSKLPIRTRRSFIEKANHLGDRKDKKDLEFFIGLYADQERENVNLKLLESLFSVVKSYKD